MLYFLCSLSEVLQSEDVSTNNHRGQATVLGRVRRLLSVQEPMDLHTRPSFKRHSSDISSFLPFGLDHHFHPRVEENMQTCSKLNFNPHFYDLSIVNEVNSTSPSPEASIHSRFPNKIPSVVVSEPHQGDCSDSDSVVQEFTGRTPSEESSSGSAQVKEHCDKHHGATLSTAEGITDTESRSFDCFSPAEKGSTAISAAETALNELHKTLPVPQKKDSER